MRIGLALVIVALFATSAHADARRRVVVLEVAGPRELADTARRGILAALAKEHDFVSPFWWQAARMATPDDGVMWWWMVAREMKVDAVVEGWIDGSQLTFQVRDAENGRIIDTASVPISDTGVVSDIDALTRALDELLAWVQGPFATSATADPRRHVVILAFAGPRDVAREARQSVLDALIDDYDLVPAFWWRAARMASTSWQEAATETKVDAIVDGWTGSDQVLKLFVRDAQNGEVVDTVSVPIANSGVVIDLSKMSEALDDVVDGARDNHAH